jgi:ribosomal protein S27AE
MTANPPSAYAAVYKAIASGELKRQPCEVCGKTNVHAHHDDYSQPLKVRWLCPLHHRQRHPNNKGYARPTTGKAVLVQREHKQQKTFTLTPTASERLTRASRETGLSESSYVEQALRLKFNQDNIE